jgi:hypothetical protein
VDKTETCLFVGPAQKPAEQSAFSATIAEMGRDAEWIKAATLAVADGRLSPGEARGLLVALRRHYAAARPLVEALADLAGEGHEPAPAKPQVPVVIGGGGAGSPPKYDSFQCGDGSGGNDGSKYQQAPVDLDDLDGVGDEDRFPPPDEGIQAMRREAMIIWCILITGVVFFSAMLVTAWIFRGSLSSIVW